MCIDRGVLFAKCVVRVVNVGWCVFSAATAGAAYGGQTGYAVAPAATAATYGTQRAAATGYDTAYQAAAATQGNIRFHLLTITAIRHC